MVKLPFIGEIGRRKPRLAAVPVVKKRPSRAELRERAAERTKAKRAEVEAERQAKIKDAQLEQLLLETEIRRLELDRRRKNLLGAAEPDGFEKYLEMRKKLADAGLDPSGQKAGGFTSTLSDVAQGMVALRDMFAMSKQGPAHQVDVPQPAELVAPASQSAPSTPPPAVSPIAPLEPLGDLLVRELEHRNPTEAADFLRHRQAHYPELTRFLTELVAVPDAFVSQVITQIRALAGWEQVGELLARKGETWLKETRDELRKHLAPAAASSNGHAEAPTDSVRVTGL